MLLVAELVLAIPIIKAANTPYNSFDTTLFELGLLFIAMTALVGGIVQGTREKVGQAMALLALFFGPLVAFCIQLMPPTH